MAFSLGKEVTFDLSRTYAGPVAVAQLEFSFVFLLGISAIDQLDFIVRTGLFAASVLPVIQSNYLGYTLESDTDPFIDRYRVTVFVAGDTEETQGSIGPFFGSRVERSPAVFISATTLLAVVIAIGIAGIFAAITYKLFNSSIGDIGTGVGNLLKGIGTKAILGSVAIVAGAVGGFLLLRGVIRGT